MAITITNGSDLNKKIDNYFNKLWGLYIGECAFDTFVYKFGIDHGFNIITYDATRAPYDDLCWTYEFETEDDYLKILLFIGES